MKRPWSLSGLVATGCLAFSGLCLGRGGSGGHGSASTGHPPGHHYLEPFGYGGYRPAGYDSAVYAYPPSPAQQAAAQQQVAQYFAAVSKKRRAAATHRCIAVATLRPTQAQREDYLVKRAAAKTAGTTQPLRAEQLQCVMVFDTQAKQFVGSGCYVLEGLPPNGAVTKFDTLRAEFVGPGTL